MTNLTTKQTDKTHLEGVIFYLEQQVKKTQEIIRILKLMVEEE